MSVKFKQLTMGLLLICCAMALFAQLTSGSPPPLLKLADTSVSHRIGVEYVRNHQSVVVDANEIVSVLRMAEKMAFDHLNLKIQFSEQVVNKEIYDIYSRISELERKRISASVYDFRNDRGDKALLIARTANSLRTEKSDNKESRAFAAPYLLAKPESDSLQDFSKALVETQLIRLKGIKVLNGDQSNLKLNENIANEFPFWLYYVNNQSRHQLILTNQIVAGAEYVGNSVHSALRGGISNGFTAEAKYSSSGISSVISLYPFYAEDSDLSAIRDGAFESEHQRRRAVAALVVHELGHQLLHLGHPYGNPHCIMNPPPLLHFKKWIEGLDAEKCRQASPDAMRPGFIEFLDVR